MSNPVRPKTDHCYTVTRAPDPYVYQGRGIGEPLQREDTIGGGPRALQKYESGDALRGRAISGAAVLLDYDPRALKVLEARFEATPSRHHHAAPDP